jgi:hypothetical protein
MKQNIGSIAMILLIAGSFHACEKGREENIYSFRSGRETRWISFENPNGEKGRGGTINRGAKGKAFDNIKAGETKVIMDVDGPGIIHRWWATIDNRSPEMLRSLRIDMYWDHEEKPAVSVPFGDFFGPGLGLTAAYESELFSSPEGKSFNSYLKMPFRKHAKITVTNESDRQLNHLFYDINYELRNRLPANTLYLHAYWNRSWDTPPGEDYVILPELQGSGRFLGCQIGLNVDPLYGDTWWGEGEVKMYLDGDGELPTLVGTGTEDYIGTGWSQGLFNNRFQGCLISDTVKKQWTFYRYHIPDPVWFNTDIRVTIQQMGGDRMNQVRSLMDKGVPLIPVTVGIVDHMVPLLDMDPPATLGDPRLPEVGWTNFYRTDDYSSVAYFYLNKPSSDLPGLPGLNVRLHDLR